jgi:hypothetical protein
MQGVLYDLAILGLEPANQQTFTIKEAIIAQANTGTYSFTNQYNYVLEVLKETYEQYNITINDQAIITNI